jgi:hypothetical protein
VQQVRVSRPAVTDGLALGLLLAALLGVSLVSIGTSSIWQPDAPPLAPWCPTDETPSFRFGFAALRDALGEVMGQPTACEHGDAVTGDTYQETSTGLAVYHWCTNTPTFSQGSDHWILTPDGMEHWVGQGLLPPQPPPIVRVPDFRHPCTP